MRVYRKGSGEKYTPFDHFGMETQVIFNPEGGCPKANITLSKFPKDSGSHDEVHENSDQVFYMIQGKLKFYAKGQLIAEIKEGDALLVLAGEVHSVRNEEEGDGILLAITVPPLDQTH
jgi:quercetin dioxygenase-like cupin family protein